METKVISFPLIEVKSQKGDEPKYRVMDEAVTFLREMRDRKVKIERINANLIDYP
jgi:hypothetical protein